MENSNTLHKMSRFRAKIDKATKHPNTLFFSAENSGSGVWLLFDSQDYQKKLTLGTWLFCIQFFFNEFTENILHCDVYQDNYPYHDMDNTLPSLSMGNGKG